MSRSATILRNVTSNWVGFAINAGVTLVLTPLVLRELGAARYGIWILTSSIVGYYGFLDLGFRAGVTQYITKFLAVRDYAAASECVSSAVAALAGFAVFIVGLSAGAAYLAPGVFGLSGELQYEAFWCILIIGCSTALQFALSPYASIFAATQRFDLANLIGVATRFLTALAIVTALWTDRGLIGVSAATCAGTIADYVLRWRVARSLAPQICVGRRWVKWHRLREVAVFGAWNSLISINAFVNQHVPNLLVGAFLPIAAVGHYALSVGLTRQILATLGPIGQVVYPAGAALSAQGDRAGLERLYHDGSRLVLLAMVSVVLPAAFWAEDFYRLWIGERYLVSQPLPSVALVFQILLIGVATSCFATVSWQILMGAGHVKTASTAAVCQSVLNLVVSCATIRRFGLLGLAWGNVIATVAIDLLLVPFLVRRKLGLRIGPFLLRSCTRPLAVAAVQVGLFTTIRFVGRAQQWPELIGQGLAALLGTIVLVGALGITGDERRRFVIEPMRRLMRKLAPVPLIDDSAEAR